MNKNLRKTRKNAVRHLKNKKTSSKLYSKKDSSAIRTTHPPANSTQADSEAILPNRTQMVFLRAFPVVTVPLEQLQDTCLLFRFHKAGRSCSPRLEKLSLFSPPLRVPKAWHGDFAACGQRSGLLALNLASIFEKLLDQKTFCLPAAHFTEHTLHYTNKKGAIPINLLSKIEPLLLKVQKPAQYIGGEMGSIRKDPNTVSVRFAFCFPDTYEIGMSHLGMKILYGLTNAQPNYACERVFCPDTDMEQLMLEHQIPLYTLESLEPVADFDLIGFTLQYEMAYTNILNMLHLAGIPLLAADRGNALTPLVFAGGPCVCNPEPIADFFDFFILGEGEEVNMEVFALYDRMKRQGADKQAFLKVVKIEGVYVPSFYDVSYHEDGTVAAVTPKHGAPEKVRKRIISDMGSVYYPEQFVVPFTEIVHDRAVEEVLRGCIRGCRFCQAGFIYRPFREKPAEVVCRQAEQLCRNTGYDELSLSSLSTSDHDQLEAILTELLCYTEERKITMSLPSLRVDNFSEDFLEKVKRIRKSGLTFAPEAGTQRLRDVINKNVTEEEILRAAQIAFSNGYYHVKLYFMMGLPTETLDDIAGIAQLAEKIINLYFEQPNRPKGKGVEISISVATFVPKPHTPFMLVPQATREQVAEKQQHLIRSIPLKHKKRIRVSWNDQLVSLLEAVLARGDRRLSAVIRKAWENGSRFDSWSDRFCWENWEKAFAECGLDPAFYANRERSATELLPWEHLDYLVDKSFFLREYERAKQAKTTPHCRKQCSGCGISREVGRACF